MSNLMVIIQARMTSTRLPGKVMLPMCNRPVLQLMFDRLSHLKKSIIVATTDDGSETPILELCKKLDIKTYQGNTEDVLGRFHDAAVFYGANKNTTIVRLTSDCPLIDPQLCDLVINKHLESQFDIVNLGPHSGYPRGLDCCAFTFNLLKKTHTHATSPADREHVTLGMAKFNSVSTYTFSLGTDLSHYRLTLDEPDDYTAIKAVYELFNKKILFSFTDLLKKLESNPEVLKINFNVKQKLT